MHIYIRTGDNESTGIEFLNGKGWSEPHIEQKGFIFTPKNAPARKYEFKDTEISKRNGLGNWGIRSEKHLATVVLLSEELSSIPETDSIESVTWVNVGRLGISCNDLMLYNELEHLKGTTAEKLNNEVKHIIYKYLNEGPRSVEVSVTEEDRKRITYDNNGARDGFGYVRKDLPQGFSITFDETVEHYSVPEFLRRALAVAALATFSVADKHQYYGELQIVSDVLDMGFIDAVNDILRGRDYYELANYLNGFFNVEKVSS